MSPTVPRPTTIRRALYARMATDSATAGKLTYHEGQTDGLLGAAPSGWQHSIYHNQAPEDASFPFVVFSKSSGVEIGPLDSFGGAVHSNDIWTVKVVDHHTTADRAEKAAERIRELLHDQEATLSFSGGTAVYLHRESDIDYSEVVDGEIYFHCGSNYRLVSHFS